MDHEIAIGVCSSWLCEINTKRCSQFRASRINVDKGNLGPRQPPAEISNEGTHDAGPYDRDAVGRTWRCVPHTVKCGFHVGRQDGPVRRHFVRQHNQGRCGNVERRLMWMEHKDVLAS